MSETSLVFKNLRNDRERAIYLLAFWEGIDAGKVLKEEFQQLEREWSSGVKGIDAAIQYATRERAKGRDLSGLARKDRI